MCAGMRDVILPKANQMDFEALKLRIKENLKVHFVDTYKEVYEIVFE